MGIPSLKDIYQGWTDGRRFATALVRAFKGDIEAADDAWIETVHRFLATQEIQGCSALPADRVARAVEAAAWAWLEALTERGINVM